MQVKDRVPTRRITNFAASDLYRAEVHHRIVGGAHTYSKGDDQWPVLAPAAIERGKGGRVWDIDGNEYVDCALGLGAVSLGHVYEPVMQAVYAQLEKGAAFQRPASIELELADAMLAAMPGMDRIKFAKNGSNVTTAAVKLARAFTGRDLVAFPADHSFYSFDDWFIGSTDARSGVPNESRRLSLRYSSTDPASLEKLFIEYPGRIAAVIMEPENADPAPAGTLAQFHQIAKAHGAVFIVDEMISGFRAGFPGSYVVQGVIPDLVTWGKAIGNGFSFCALTGRAEIMDLGGIKHTDRAKVFLLSSTHGGEAHTLAAALAVLREYQEKDVIGRHHDLVARIAAGMETRLAAHRLGEHIDVMASPWRVCLGFRDREGKSSPAFRTLVLQELAGHGVLCQGVYVPCYAHTAADVAQILDGFDKACAVYSYALEEGVDKVLVGRPARPVFRKYNGCTTGCSGDPCPNEAQCQANRT